MNKKDGSRDCFIPREGKLYLQFDYDAYHVRLIGKMIHYDLPKTSVHQWLADQYGMDYDESKGRTFRILYGGVSEDDKSIPFFEELPNEQIDDLSMIITDQVFDRGQIIFSEGDDGIGFYVVVTGRVKIFKLSPDGKEQILHIFGPGDPFGEVAVFAGQHFPANAEAMESSRIFFFPRESFSDLIRNNPSLALNMLAILSKRLRRFANLIDDLSLKEVPGRLAAHLLYLSGKTEGS